jgi:peptidyl-prolyl cis-trans isomerase C
MSTWCNFKYVVNFLFRFYLEQLMKNKIAIVVLLTGIVVSPSQAATAPQQQGAKTNAAATGTTQSLDKKNGEIIAKGKGVSVKRSDLNEAISSISAGMAAQGREVPRDQIEALEPQILDRLIMMQLLTSKATDQDKQRGKETAQKRVEELKMRSGSDDNMERQLKLVGMTMKEFEAKLTEEAVAEAVLESGLQPEVTDAEARKFYEENPSRFEQPEMVRASHILLMTKDETGADLPPEKKEAKRKQIEDLLKKARAGEDFAELAKKHSEDPGSKDKGGEYIFPRGQMVPEFEKAAFNLKTNEVSDVVTTQYGFHIIKLSEKIPAKKIAFEEIAPKIKEALKAQEMQQGLAEYVTKLREEANVQILDKDLKARAEMITNGVPGQGKGQPQPQPQLQPQSPPKTAPSTGKKK